MREYGLSLTRILAYKDKIYHSVLLRENTGQWKPVFLHILCSAGLYISKVSIQRLVFGHFWLFSQNNQPVLDWKSKNGGLKDWKNCQENISLFSTKRKLAGKMNGSFLIDQVRSCMLPYTSQIVEEDVFRLSYLPYDFMVTNLVRLNIVVLKMSEMS